MRRTNTATLTTTALTSTVLLGAALLAPTPSSAAGSVAGETCHGQTATILATKGYYTGTEGNDVVVITGGTGVDLLGGDDLVCVVGPPLPAIEGSGSVYIDAGSGDDVVDTTAARRRRVQVEPGSGADRFEGGPGMDIVDAFHFPGTKHESDDEPNVYLGGGGDDWFRSGADGEPNSDIIDLGDGNDRLTFSGTLTGKGSIVGGPGTDRIDLLQTKESATIDNAIGRFVDGDTTIAAWRSFENFHLAESYPTTSHLDFVGSAGHDSLFATGAPLLSADFGQGNDTLSSPAAFADGSIIDAGPGRDRVSGDVYGGTFALDLASGLLLRRGGRASHTMMKGFEDAWIKGENVKLFGTTRANRLSVVACDGFVKGRGGDDTINRLWDLERFHSNCDGQAFRVIGGGGNDKLIGGHGEDRLLGGAGNDTLTGEGDGDGDHLFGGPGDDRLFGRTGDDVLLGGPGRDSADGGPGRDRCAAEVRKQCERH